MLSNPHNKICLDISKERSSLICKLEYWPDHKILAVYFHHGKPRYRAYEDVSADHFHEVASAKSIGKMYLRFIKTNFKQKNYQEMAERKIQGVNIASNEKRFIKISLNVQEINKDWLLPGEKGTYLNITFALLPDGEVDRYTNCGMVTQDVPKFVYEKEKNLPKAEKTQGNILGNGFEFPKMGSDVKPGETLDRELTEEEKAEMNDLPF